MKPVLLFLVCWLCMAGTSFRLSAQDVSSVQRAYHEVRRNITAHRDEPNTLNEMELTVRHNVPGIGPQTIRYTFYLSPLRYDDTGKLLPHRLLLVERSYNVAAQKFQEEFLYDDEGHLLFTYEEEPLANSTEPFFVQTCCYFHHDVLLDMICFEVSDEGSRELLHSSEEGDTPYVRQKLGQAAAIHRMVSDIVLKGTFYTP